ncbi:MAG TPA: tetratricopeptide repeat protein [Acidobacteriota bacterium]|nr:tetratricopeptide repeat protein [Acidobacteriota bacterium]HNJ39721.1 tetratricopeptide repeat protein [Acidobacteriota bacterium]
MSSSSSTHPSFQAEIAEALRGLEILIEHTTVHILAFLRYQRTSERETALTLLREHLKLPVWEFRLSPEKDDPIKLLFEVPPAPRACVIFYDVENALPRLAGYVNLQRERLTEVPHAVLFCVREYGLREIGLHAPDFFSWSSGTWDITTHLPAQEIELPLMPLDDLSGFRNREEAEQKLHLYQELYDEYSRQEQPDQVFLADTLQKQALALYFLGRYKESVPLLEQSLTMYESHLGLNHQKTVAGLTALAVLYGLKGSFIEAEKMLNQAVELSAQFDPATVVNSLQALSALYNSQKKFKEARDLLDRALTICRKSFGNHHPTTARSLSYLGAWAYNQMRYTEAIAYLEEALTICEKVFGRQHPATGQILNNLAVLYVAQGKFETASKFYEQGLQIWKTRLGEDHPFTKILIGNYADLLWNLGRTEEARTLEGKVADTG